MVAAGEFAFAVDDAAAEFFAGTVEGGFVDAGRVGFGKDVAVGGGAIGFEIVDEPCFRVRFVVGGGVEGRGGAVGEFDVAVGSGLQFDAERVGVGAEVGFDEVEAAGAVVPDDLPEEAPLVTTGSATSKSFSRPSLENGMETVPEVILAVNSIAASPPLPMELMSNTTSGCSAPGLG